MPQPLHIAAGGQRARNAVRLAPARDAGPQGVAGVRGNAVDAALVAVERECVDACVAHPEAVLEALTQLLGGLFLGFGESVIAAKSRQPGHAAPRREYVALNLDQRDRALGKRPVAIADRRRTSPSSPG